MLWAAAAPRFRVRANPGHRSGLADFCATCDFCILRSRKDPHESSTSVSSRHHHAEGRARAGQGTPVGIRGRGAVHGGRAGAGRWGCQRQPHRRGQPQGGVPGTGLLSKSSKIRIRLITRNANDAFDRAFWKRKVAWAWEYRKTVMGEDASCCRVLFSEADGFPGLVVDRFNDVLVAETLSVGMEQLKPVIFPVLLEVLAGGRRVHPRPVRAQRRGNSQAGGP